MEIAYGTGRSPPSPCQVMGLRRNDVGVRAVKHAHWLNLVVQDHCHAVAPGGAE